jgi:uncharacterized membrane protein (TIGR01666 family)
MKKIDTYKNFFNSRYLNEGIRMTVGIALPAFILSFFGYLSFGIELSLGALAVSISDSPGPVRHRVNGMLFTILLVSITAVLVYYAQTSVLLLAIFILVFGFLFSMLTVYGVRSSSVGIAALLIMILSLQNPLHGIKIWQNAALVFIGGVWYMLFSLALYTIRPYKIIQQILGDFIIDIGEYLKTRGNFYESEPEYEKTYQLLLQQQVKIQTEQSLLSDLLFKTRTIVRESTHKGRVLMKIYVDVTELFESIMTSFQDYKVLHSQFDDTKILAQLGKHILLLSDEMNAIGLAVKTGIHSNAANNNLTNVNQIKALFESMRKNYMNDENLDNFISLGRIVSNIQYLTDKINGLHHYTSYDKKIKRATKDSIESSNYAESQDIRPAIFFNNLNFNSNIFRHSLRVSLSLLLGYLISLWFNIGHSYWILLTIVVILKPAYSLTKKRNTDRLIGTMLGIIIGVILLYFIHDKSVLLIIMVFFMVTCYSFIRTNYFISVLAMTPYLVLFFFLLYPSSIKILLTDRVIDTCIGSSIAFIASIFLVPVWEKTGIKAYMIKMLEADKVYYHVIAAAFCNNATLQVKEFKLIRRNLLTSLANVSDAFSRMLSEPKRFQNGVEAIHRFVVLNHILTSHFATLSYYLNVKSNRFRSQDLIPVMENTQLYFSNAINHLQNQSDNNEKADRISLNKLNEQALLLLEKRKQEIILGNLETDTKELLVEVKSVIDQFNYVYGIASDIEKCTRQVIS